MRVDFVSLSIALALFSGAAGVRPLAAQSSAPALTLAEAVRTALDKNQAVEAAGAYAEAVKEGIAVARSSRYPRVDFSETVTRGNNPVYVFGSLLSQGQFAAPNFSIPFLNYPPPFDNFRTQFSTSMPLWDAGRTSRRLKDAHLGSQDAAHAFERTRQQIVFQVIQAYLNGLLAREGVRVAEAAVEMTQADLKRATARQNTGLAVPSDLLSAQVQLAQAKDDLLRTKNSVALADAALNVAMGIPEDTPVALAGAMDEVQFEAGTLEERVDRALKSRPDFQQAQIAYDRAENQRRMSRSGYLPSLSIFGSWERDNQTFLTRGNDNWVAGASLNFNIFDGGAREAHIRESVARKRQAGAMRSQLASAVRLQVREAYLNLTTASDRVNVSRDAAAQAEESLRITQNRYEAGLDTITDLLRTETARTAARKNHLNALFDYRLSFAALELATGELAADSAAVRQ